MGAQVLYEFDGEEDMQNCSEYFVEFQTRYLPPIFGLEFLVAICGNALAIYLFFTREKTWHTGIIYSFNLAVSDLLYTLSLPLLIAYYAMDKHWIFGSAVCKLERFFFNCNLYGSIFFVTCISLNRYVAIVFPMYAHGRVEPKHAKIISLVTWILVAGISAPVFKFSALDLRNPQHTECIGTARTVELTSYIPYSLFLAVFGCGIPFLLTLLSYVSIAWTVFKSESLSALEKKKVWLMVFSVVALYAVSFVPYHVLRNINLYNRIHRLNCTDSVTVHSAMQVAKALVTLNVCIHPLLYASVADSMRCSRKKDSPRNDIGPI
ncbi:P2Y purinoceptor 11 isoform X1 [Lissotriton helveticus]